MYYNWRHKNRPTSTSTKYAETDGSCIGRAQPLKNYYRTYRNNGIVLFIITTRIILYWLLCSFFGPPPSPKKMPCRFRRNSIDHTKIKEIIKKKTQHTFICIYAYVYIFFIFLPYRRFFFLLDIYFIIFSCISETDDIIIFRKFNFVLKFDKKKKKNESQERGII